jgi:hypothetical protein
MYGTFRFPLDIGILSRDLWTQPACVVLQHVETYLVLFREEKRSL